MSQSGQKLFRVKSLANEFPYMRGYFNDVRFNWYVTERKDPVIPFEVGIKDYAQHQNDPALTARETLNELFTAAEAEALQAYLLKVHNIPSEIEEAALPLEPDSKGIAALPPGRGSNTLLLYLDEEYALPFRVRGHFSVNPEQDVTELVLGTLYVQKLFKKLGRELPAEPGIRKIVAELRDEGLLIARCPTKEEIEEAKQQRAAFQESN